MKLKNCPFCGNNNLRTGNMEQDQNLGEMVYCVDCHIVAPINTWNMRPVVNPSRIDYEQGK